MLLNVAAYKVYRKPVLFTFLATFTKTPLAFEKKCMSDNIRNKTIFEIKIAKIAQNLPKFDILHI